MKRKIAVLTAALMIMVLAAGCRSKGNDNKTPSTTTVPTTMPTTQSTTVPETETTDSTIPSGNGPIDETAAVQTDGTEPENTGNGTAEGAAGNASRSGMSPNNGSKANTGR